MEKMLTYTWKFNTTPSKTLCTSVLLCFLPVFIMQFKLPEYYCFFTDLVAVFHYSLEKDCSQSECVGNVFGPNPIHLSSPNAASKWHIPLHWGILCYGLPIAECITHPICIAALLLEFWRGLGPLSSCPTSSIYWCFWWCWLDCYKDTAPFGSSSLDWLQSGPLHELPPSLTYPPPLALS